MIQLDKVRHFLFDKITDRDDLNDSVIASHLKLSTKQVGNLRSGKRKLTLRSILVLSQLVVPERYREFMREVCPRLVDSSDCIRKTFEYAAITRDKQLLDQHLENYRHEKRNVIEKYVKVYSFISDYLHGNIPFHLIEDELSKLTNINDPILKILVDIYYCIALLQKRQFSYVINKASELEIQIKGLNDKPHLFLKECYSYRISEVLAYAHLFLNNLKQARHYANILYNASINKRVNSDALYIIGMTYLISDENLCLSYLKRSIDEAEKTGEMRLVGYAVYNYNFARLLMKRKIDNDAPNVLKNMENFIEGRMSFVEVEKEIRKTNDPDLIGYFESKAGGKETLYKKFCDFVSNSNLFYATIIVRELVRSGESTDFIESLTKNLKYTREEKGEVVFEEDFISCFNVGLRDGVGCRI